MKKMMKIMLGLLLSTVLVLTMLGCDNGSTDDDKSGGDTDNIQGWWKYTISVATVKSSTYIEYDSSGKVLRAGSSNLEYKDVKFDNQVKTLEYNSLKKLVGTHTSFTKIDEESLPSWVNSSIDEGYNDLIGRWESDERTTRVGTGEGASVECKTRRIFIFDTQNRISRIDITTDSHNTSKVPNGEETFGPYDIISTRTVEQTITLTYLNTVVDREWEIVITFTDANKNAISVDPYDSGIFNKK